MRGHLIVTIALVGGCATSNSGGSNSANAFRDQFPSRQVLEKIAASPRPAKLSLGGGATIDRWQLTGPVPALLEPIQYSDGSPWQRTLETVAARRPGLVTLPASMQCVAREIGRFHLAKRLLPDERLRAFIAARCGVFAVDVTADVMFGPAAPDASLERMFEASRPVVERRLGQLLDGGAKEAGIWLGRDQEHAVIMICTAQARARLARTAIVPGADGSFIVSGELLEAGEQLDALINHGHHGFSRCSVDPMVRLPRFVVSCAADVTDTSAWLEIAAFPAGRIMGHVVARLLVWPGGAPSLSYEPAEYVHHASPVGADPRGQLLQLLNEVRAQAELPPVALAARESNVAEQVAPHYFAALVGSEPELVADEVVLGLRAGWEVEGDVGGSNFTFGLVEKSDDLARLLDTVLERPSGREALLSRTDALVALGTVIAPEQHVVAMVASSYRLMGPGNHAGDAQRVLGRWTKARVSARMSPPPATHRLDAQAQDAVARVERGESDPNAAMNRMLERAAGYLPGTVVRGWVYEASSIDELTFSPEMLRMPLADVGIAVGHYRPKGAPWSRLIIFVVATTADIRGSVARDHVIF